MEIETRTDRDIQIMKVRSSRVDAAVAIQFKDAVRSAVDPAARRLILDLGAVEFIDSSGLGAVVASMKQIGPDQTMELASLTGMVEKVFRLTRMDTVFAIHPTAEAARLSNAQ